MKMQKQKKFLELYLPVKRKLERFVLSITADAETAKDIVGETVLIVYDGLEKIETEKAFLSYLFTVARRINVNRIRKYSRLVTIDSNEFDELSSSTLSPENSTDIAFLKQALSKLDSKYRDALLLFEISGFSIKETADIENITVASCKVRLFRARKKLASLLSVKNNKNKIKEINKTPVKADGGKSHG